MKARHVLVSVTAALALLAGAAPPAAACTTIVYKEVGVTWAGADPWGYGFDTLITRSQIEADACITETEVSLKTSVDFTPRGWKARYLDYLTWNLFWRPPTANEINSLTSGGWEGWYPAEHDDPYEYALHYAGSVGHARYIFDTLACSQEAADRGSKPTTYCGWSDGARAHAFSDAFDFATGCASSHSRWVAKDDLRLLIKSHPIIDEIGLDNDIYFDKIWLRQDQGDRTGWGWGFVDVRQIYDYTAGVPTQCYNPVMDIGGDQPGGHWKTFTRESDRVTRLMFQNLVGDSMPVCGDVNGNGHFDPDDVQKAATYLWMGCVPTTACGTGNLNHCADVNASGGPFDGTDLVLMQNGNLHCAPDPLARFAGLPAGSTNLVELVQPLSVSTLRTLIGPFVNFFRSQI